MMFVFVLICNVLVTIFITTYAVLQTVMSVVTKTVECHDFIRFEKVCHNFTSFFHDFVVL